MGKRIESLTESPCYKCGYQLECLERIKRSPKLMEICDSVIWNSEFDYKECSLWIAIDVDKKMRMGDYNS